MAASNNNNPLLEIDEDVPAEIARGIHEVSCFLCGAVQGGHLGDDEAVAGLMHCLDMVRGASAHLTGLLAAHRFSAGVGELKGLVARSA